MDPFVFKQFDVSKAGASVIDFDMQKFEDKINSSYDPKDLKDGYAPFCKHLFVPNFTSA